MYQWTPNPNPNGRMPVVRQRPVWEVRYLVSLVGSRRHTAKKLLLLKGTHQALGSEATKAMEVAREASQKAQLASEAASRSAATAKGASMRTAALRNDVSHINKELDNHQAAT